MTRDPEAQEALATELAARLARAGRGLPYPGTPGPGLCCVSVIRDLDVREFLRDTLAFAGGVPVRLRDGWYRNFTQTLFFAGNPAHLPAAFTPAHLSRSGAAAWLGPAEQQRFRDLSRLLRLFRAPYPPPVPARLELRVPGAPASGRVARLRIAVAAVATAEYLVHVHHVLSEGVLCGLLQAGDLLRVRHVDELAPAEVLARGDRGALFRVAQDSRRPGWLRLHARLTTDRWKERRHDRTG